MKKIFFVVLVNFLLIFAIDQIAGFILPDTPTYFSGKSYYSSNYRGYFLPRKLDNGETVYFIPPSRHLVLHHEQRKKSSSYFKLLAFGDSFTIGQGVSAHDTWVKQLEAYYPQGSFLASNYGMGGFGVDEVVLEIEDRLKKEDANLLVYAFVLNDPIYLPTPEGIRLDRDFKNDYGDDTGLYYDFILWRTRVFELNRSKVYSFLSRVSYIARYFISQLELKRVGKNTERFYHHLYDSKINQEGLKHTFKVIDKMKKLADDKKIPFVVMIFPLFYQTQSNYPFAEIHHFMSLELNKRGISSFDLLPAYTGVADRELWVHPTDQHPNNFAHKIAALTLKSWIERNIFLK